MSSPHRVVVVTGASQGIGAGLAAITKGGLNALTKSLAIEVAKRGVRVNAVAPGATKTPMHAPATYDFLAKIHPVQGRHDSLNVCGRHPLRRAGDQPTEKRWRWTRVC